MILDSTILSVRFDRDDNNVYMEFYVNGVFIPDIEDLKKLYQDIFEVIVLNYHREIGLTTDKKRRYG